MAKTKTLDEAVDKIFKNYKTAIKNAAKEATEQAKDDLYTHAISCLVQYYDDYNPTSYSRSYHLIDCFVPYAKPVREVGDEIICVAGVEFDPSKIEGVYHGSSTYSDTDAEWIIANFLSGIHPRTDGSREIGGGDYEAQKEYGSFVPSYEMQKYTERYRNIFYDNLRFALSKSVLKLTTK